MINGSGSGFGYGNRRNQPYYAPVANSASDASALMSRVAYLLCTALVVTAGGCYVGRDLSPGFFWPLAIGTIACVFGVNFARNNPPLGLTLLYVLSLLEGLLLAPLINMLTRSLAGAQIVEAAFAITAIVMAGLGSYVWISGSDFIGLGKYLMYGLIGLILVGFLGFFVRPIFENAHFNMLYSIIGAAIFIGFTLYDFSNIKLRYGPNDYVMATVQLYLDFLNLFLFILQILMSFAGGGSNRR